MGSNESEERERKHKVGWVVRRTGPGGLEEGDYDRSTLYEILNELIIMRTNKIWMH